MNDLFEMMDYGDKNFTLESGSYFVIMCGLVGYYIFRYIVNQFARCYSRVKCCRKIGIAAYEESYIFTLR